MGSTGRIGGSGESLAGGRGRLDRTPHSFPSLQNLHTKHLSIGGYEQSMTPTIVSREPVGGCIVELGDDLPRTLRAQTRAISIVIHEGDLLRRLVGGIEVIFIEDEVQTVDELLVPTLKFDKLRGVMRDVLRILRVVSLTAEIEEGRQTHHDGRTFIVAIVVLGVQEAGGLQGIVDAAMSRVCKVELAIGEARLRKDQDELRRKGCSS